MLSFMQLQDVIDRPALAGRQRTVRKKKGNMRAERNGTARSTGTTPDRAAGRQGIANAPMG